MQRNGRAREKIRREYIWEWEEDDLGEQEGKEENQGGEGRELKGEEEEKEEEEEEEIGEERSSDIRRELLCRRRIKNRRMKKGGGESLVFPLLISFSSVSPRISTA